MGPGEGTFCLSPREGGSLGLEELKLFTLDFPQLSPLQQPRLGSISQRQTRARLSPLPPELKSNQAQEPPRSLGGTPRRGLGPRKQLNLAEAQGVLDEHPVRGNSCGVRGVCPVSVTPKS